MIRSACIAVFCLVLACAGCARRPAPVAAPDRPPSLVQAKQAVAGYYETGPWEKACRNATSALLKHVEGDLAQPLSARPAVVLDLEDVLLSSYELRKNNNFCVTPKDIEAWILTEFMPPTPSLPETAGKLQSMGVKVFVVSMRPEGFRLPTLENLSQAGYAPDALYMPPPGDESLTPRVFKTKIQAMLAGQGFAILAWMADHQGETDEEDANDVFIIPNLMY